MSFWDCLCCCFPCCFRRKFIPLNEETRLLPKGEAEPYPKQRDKFVVFSYGVLPSGFHLKVLPSIYTGRKIQRLACGSGHFVLLTETGHVLTAGMNEFGQCGKEPDQEIREDNEIREEQRVELRIVQVNDVTVKDVAAGAYHTLILGTPNVVLALGHESACGFMDKNHHYEPTEIPLPERYSGCSVHSVYAGQMRSCVILDNGKVLIWGVWVQAKKFRAMKELEIPLSANDSIGKIEIGKNHSLFLTKEGAVYSWGDNTYGELGVNSNTRNVESPSLVPFFREKKVKDIAAGARHSLVLDFEGNLYAFGDNSEGQCGFEARRAYVPESVLVGEIGHISAVWAGDSHSAYMTESHDLYVWGDNTANRLGIPSTMKVLSPKLLDELFGRNISTVGLGGVFTLILAGPTPEES